MATSTAVWLPVIYFVGLFLLLPVNLVDACGYVLNQDRAVISSPSFPHNYPKNSFCQWDIMAPQTALFTLNFTHFYLEGHVTCAEDYLIVLGKASKQAEWRKLGQFCGHGLPPTITFEGTKMRLQFRSDEGLEDIGFFAEYFFVVSTTTPPTIATTSPKEISNKEDGLADETPIAMWSPENVNDEVGLAKVKLFNWFLGLRRQGEQTRKWDHQLPRIAVALFLAAPEKFKSGIKTIYEMNTELTIRLFSKILGGGHLERRDLSIYIPALMVVCVDPRNFHGRDLVAELRSDIESSNATVSPFELLVLCNAGDAMTSRDVQRIATIFDSQHRQALLATNSLERDFDLGSAVRALVAAQRENGSVGSFLDSYYVLPALANATLLDVTAQHCKRQNISETEALSELRGSIGSRVSITYSVAFGTDVDFKRTLTLKVPVNSSLYNVLEAVQKLDSRQQLEYTVIEGKPFVSSVMGIQDDVETGFYWFTYLRKHNAENSILVEDSPVDVKIETNQELILWYKSGQWN